MSFSNNSRYQWNVEYAEELMRLSGWTKIECMYNATGATKTFDQGIDPVTAANEEYESWRYESEF